MVAEDIKVARMQRLTIIGSLLLLPLALQPVARAEEQSSGVSTMTEASVPIVIGKSVVALNGPWKFHPGDDPQWSDPNFDDSSWETVDLTAPAGAHDSDVGLSGYVPGWTSRGHAGYWGYGWYRMRVPVTASSREALALAGPPDVDSAYQVFVNGQLAGSAGKFTGPTPMAYSMQPRMFPLPRSPALTSGENDLFFVIAFRVWMGPWELSDPEAGGIHIAPALGESDGVRAHYQVQWLETVRGYVVEVVEAVSFLLLAVMASSLLAFDRRGRAYRWLLLAMVLTALMRVNQALFFWGQFETVQEFELITPVLLIPMMLGAWTMAWRCWFRLRDTTWMPAVIGGLTPLYVSSQFLNRSRSHGIFSHPLISSAGFISTGVRLLFALLMILIVYKGVRQQGREGWFAVPAVVLISVGLFAQELSALHIRGIWFPFGTGVSRTQFAYAAFLVAQFALLLRRLLLFARRERGAAGSGHFAWSKEFSS
jgi:hypothetical protein